MKKYNKNGQQSTWLCSIITIGIMIVIGLAGCASSGPSDDFIFWDTALLSSVTRVTNDGIFKFNPKISPDGTKLLYIEEIDTGSIHNRNIVLLRNPTIANKTTLVSGAAVYHPGWSDNSTNYYYVVLEDDTSKLIRSSATGVGKTYVTRSPIGKDDRWPSGRGSAIVCSTVQGGKNQIVTLKENGTEITFLGEGFGPSWHPTEAKIVFVNYVSATDSLKAIYEMDLESGQVTEVYRDPNRYNCDQPSYSADGRYILFQKGAEVVTTGSSRDKTEIKTSKEKKWQIFIMNADGTSGLSALTGGRVDTYSPSMDADGWLYFIADFGRDKTEIYRARVNLDMD